MDRNHVLSEIPWGELRSRVSECVAVTGMQEGPSTGSRVSTAVLDLMALLAGSEPATQREMMAYAHRENGWDYAWWARKYVRMELHHQRIFTGNLSQATVSLCQLLAGDGKGYGLYRWTPGAVGVATWLKEGGDMPLCQALCVSAHQPSIELDRILGRIASGHLNLKASQHGDVGRCVRILQDGGVEALYRESLSPANR